MNSQKIIVNSAFVAAVVAGSLFVAVSAPADNIAFNFNGESPNGGAGYANGVGLAFTVGSQNLQATALGATGWISDWNDTLHTSAGLDSSLLTLKLWRVSDGALLATATLSSADYSTTWHPSPNNYNMPYLSESVSPITLVSGVQYQVALYNTNVAGFQYINGLDSAAIKPVVASEITFNNNRFANAGGFIMPNVVDAGATVRYGGPTFEFIVRSPTVSWNSTSSQFWNAAGDANWLNTGTSTSDVFLNGDAVTFGDTAGLQTSITINSSVQPSSVTVNSTVNNYTFSGTGISGAGSLLKLGGSTLTLKNTNSYSGGTTVNGGKLSIDSSGYNALNLTAAVSIGANAIVSADQAASNAHNIGALTLNGGTLTSINGPGGAANDGGFGNWLLRGVTVGGSSLSTISSSTLAIVSGSFDVADSVAGPGVDLSVSSRIISGALTKTGVGTMQLTGANTFSGATTINAGAVSIDAENRLGANPGAFNAAQLTLNGGTLQTTATFTIDDTNRGITVGALGGAIETSAGTTLTVARAITSTAGAVGLTKTGAGMLELTAVNNFTNSKLTVNGGTVNISALQTFTGGTVVVNSGTLNLASASTFNLLSGNPNIFIGEGATVSAANTTSNNAHNIGSVTMTGGTLTSNATGDGGFGHWLINGNSVTTNASALQSTITAGSMDLRGITTFTVADGGAAIDLLVSSRLFNGDLTKAGTGWMQLTSSTNAFAGRTVTVDGGTLELKAVNDVSGGNVIVNSGLLRLNGNIYNQLGLGSLAAVTIGAGGTVDAASTSQNAHNIGALMLNGGTLTSTGTADFGNGNFLLQGNVTVNGAVQSTISAAAVNLTSGARSFNVADGAAPVDLLVSSFLFNGGFVKTGAGTMNLTRAGSFSGQTIHVSEGRLNLAGSAYNLLGGGANVVVGEGAILSAANSADNAHNINTLNLTGGTLTSNSVDSALYGNWLLNGDVTTDASAVQSNISAVRVALQGTRKFTVADGAAPVDLAVSSILFNGNGIATGSVIKEGAGLMSLSGANVYNGTTNINAGTLRVDGTHSNAGNYTIVSGATLGGSGVINLAAGASIDVMPTPGIVSPGPGFTGSDPANIADVGTLTINAANAASAALDMNGILQIDIVSATQYDVLNIATGIIDIDPGAVLNINGHTDLSLLDLRLLGLQIGDRITFLHADQIGGNFSNFFANQNIGAVGGSLFLGNDGTSLFLVATPEPTCLVVWMMLGTVGLGFACRTQRAARRRSVRVVH